MAENIENTTEMLQEEFDEDVKGDYVTGFKEADTCKIYYLVLPKHTVELYLISMGIAYNHYRVDCVEWEDNDSLLSERKLEPTSK